MSDLYPSELQGIVRGRICEETSSRNLEKENRNEASFDVWTVWTFEWQREIRTENNVGFQSRNESSLSGDASDDDENTVVVCSDKDDRISTRRQWKKWRLQGRGVTSLNNFRNTNQWESLIVTLAFQWEHGSSSEDNGSYWITVRLECAPYHEPIEEPLHVHSTSVYCIKDYFAWFVENWGNQHNVMELLLLTLQFSCIVSL